MNESEYTYNPSDGTITFKTAQASTKYIYVTLYDPYLRQTNPIDNRLCLDCHVIGTHKGKDCLECHGMHNTDNLYNVRRKIRTNGVNKDVEFGSQTAMSGKKGVCVVCHTITFYHNTTLTAPAHHDRENCTTCHPHSNGFPSFTTVFNGFIRRIFAVVGLDYAYADPPPLENNSMGGNSFYGGSYMEGPVMSFTVTATVVRNTKSAPQPTTKEVVYYYHNDHLGTPLFISDESGKEAWRREQMPFGEDTFQRGTVIENLRLPGQYYDSETGLHQNWHRDYSAKLGRYVEADPVLSPEFSKKTGCGETVRHSLNPGLSSDVIDISLYSYADSVGKPSAPQTNLYNFVGNNPVNYIDPLGLFSVSRIEPIDFFMEPIGFRDVVRSELRKKSREYKQKGDICRSSRAQHASENYGYWNAFWDSFFYDYDEAVEKQINP